MQSVDGRKRRIDPRQDSSGTRDVIGTHGIRFLARLQLSALQNRNYLLMVIRAEVPPLRPHRLVRQAYSLSAFVLSAVAEFLRLLHTRDLVEW